MIDDSLIEFLELRQSQSTRFGRLLAECQRKARSPSSSRWLASRGTGSMSRSDSTSWSRAYRRQYSHLIFPSPLVSHATRGRIKGNREPPLCAGPLLARGVPGVASQRWNHSCAPPDWRLGRQSISCSLASSRHSLILRRSPSCPPPLLLARRRRLIPSLHTICSYPTVTLDETTLLNSAALRKVRVFNLN